MAADLAVPIVLSLGYFLWKGGAFGAPTPTKATWPSEPAPLAKQAAAAYARATPKEKAAYHRAVNPPGGGTDEEALLRTLRAQRAREKRGA